MKKKTVNRIFEEVIANGIGWIAGLLSIDLLDLFFIQKSWKNAWGIFSKRTALDATTFSFLEWTLTAIIGFIVMLIVNKFVRSRIFKKRRTDSNTEEIQTETQLNSNLNNEVSQELLEDNFLKEEETSSDFIENDELTEKPE